MKKSLIILIIATLSSSVANADTVVTHYIVKTQEERKSTRWTLTEWLRIKERMKMMDLWLAMFSNPDKDQFRPELNLSYQVTRGHISVSDSNDNEESSYLEGTHLGGQLWLTNLISGSTGLRTLNIDLGIEGQLHSSSDVDFSMPTETTTTTSTELGTASTTSYANKITTGNLRIFGGNVQDTSLILKYGRYELENGFLKDSETQQPLKTKGLTAGGEMILYLFGGLGAEGHYQVFGDDAGVQGNDSQKGSYWDYQGFIEISLFRITFGKFSESWTSQSIESESPVNTYESTYDGYIAGLKLLF